MALLSVRNLSVSFHSRSQVSRVVNEVSFDLEEGQTLGIVGESGSGKSVTCFSLLGLIAKPAGQVDSGEAMFDGQNLLALSEKRQRAFRGRRISMIFQDPMTSLNPYMRIGQQIAEAIKTHADISQKQALERAVAALEEVGIYDAKERINDYPHEFSGGMRQRVMIAMALATEPEILIADEPTTALDVTVQAQILELLASIQKKRKLSIVFITHDLAVIHDIADYVLVMEKGHIVERGVPQAIFNAPQHDYTQKLISAIPRGPKDTGLANDSEASELLAIDNLSTHYRLSTGFWSRGKQNFFCAVDKVSLSIRKGEILGLVGESGSGKSSLGRTIMRLVHAHSGSVKLDGVDLLALEGKDLKQERQHFQMIFQDPYASLNPRMNVFSILREPLRLRGIVDKATLDNKINELMDDVGLERQALHRYPHEFSGGQRQRIAIARALATDPKLIIADEPVSALDVTIQKQILELLLKLCKERELTMIFISHDLSVVRKICDKVAVMKRGQLVEVDDCEALFSSPSHAYTQGLIDAIPIL